MNHRDDETEDREQAETAPAGQVSEVSAMANAAVPIQPDQSVAGSPDEEPGGVDEGAQGPNANPNAGASRT